MSRCSVARRGPRAAPPAFPWRSVVALAGHSPDSEPTVEPGSSVLDDLPILNKVCRGTIHQRDERTLLILVRPSIIVQEEED